VPASARSTIARRLAPILVVAAVAASCTTSTWDTGAADRPTATTAKVYSLDESGVIESLTDHLSDVGSNLNEWAAPHSEAACAARKIVHQLGADRLLDLGYDPQDGKLALQFTDDERIAVSNILDGCIDFAAGLESLFAAYDKLSVTASECLAGGIERKGLARDFAKGVLSGSSADPFADDNALGTAMSRLMLECLNPDTDLMPLAPASPFPQDADATTTTVSAGDSGAGS
jgi:hypothetical protein